MTFQAEEQSVESGRPVFLFRIVVGSTEFRYTKGAQDVIVLGDTWTAIPIRRDEFVQSSEDRDQPKSFQVPGDNQFVQNFVLSAPSEVPTIEVLEFHFGDSTDVKNRWAGEIAEIDWVDDSSWARIVARPVEGGLDAKYPRLDAGILCPYMVYDDLCQASEAVNTFSGTASAVVGDTLVVSGLDAGTPPAGGPPPWARGGKIRVDSTGEVRMIMEHSTTDTLRLGSAFKDDPTGLAVTVVAGCDRTLATCTTKFSNDINYGGRPYIPIRDPQDSVL